MSSLPVSVHWDTDDMRLLACELRCVQKKSQQTKLTKKTSAHLSPDNQIGIKSINNAGSGKSGSSAAFEFDDSYTSVMFVTDKYEIKELERVCMVAGEQLVNLCIPNVVSLSTST